MDYNLHDMNNSQRQRLWRNQAEEELIESGEISPENKEEFAEKIEELVVKKQIDFDKPEDQPNMTTNEDSEGKPEIINETEPKKDQLLKVKGFSEKRFM